MSATERQDLAEAAIAVRGLRKSYGQMEAVRGIDLTVARGEVFAILGPNGAGKTTTVEILEGHLDRTDGEVSVLGYDPGRHERSFRQRIGIVLQSAGADPYLSVDETVDLFRGYYPNPLPHEQILDLVGLVGQRRMLVRRLSGGQQRRLDVAIGLAGNPELLFLDEPTTGFDPSARRDAWEMVRNLKSLGKTVVLTTHYMEEAEYLADRVAILVQGKIVADGPLSDLVRGDAPTTIRFAVGTRALRPPAHLRAESIGEDGGYAITTGAPTGTLHRLTGWAVEQGIELERLSVAAPSLEEVFLELTGSSDPGGTD